MRGRLSPDAKEEIRNRVDLVELVSEHVALKRAGRYYKGLCPFHSEKTPSFHVDRDRGLWYCFGCSAGGDLYEFVMRISNLPFPEAVETLARRAGVRLERTPEERRQVSERERLYRALDAAAQFFRDQLLDPQMGRAARRYLQRRGVDDATAERFRLGYAPDSWDALLGALTAKGYPPALLEQGGVVQRRAGGDGYYDLLRHRLIFPFFDLQNRVVAFGGRALDDADPKYLNTRETAVFAKGRTLYGLNWAREAIRRHEEVIVVEGNMDMLTAHQFGITNTVATLGTALTAEQVLLLKRFAARAVLVYDADASGQAAMERAMALFDEADLPVRVVVLPSGDPDAFLRAQGPEAFRQLVARATPVFDYQVAMAVARHDPAHVDGKVRIVDELLPVLAAVGNPIRQAEYIKALAERLDLREDALRQRLRARVRTPRAPEPPPLVAPPERARHRAERLLVHLMVADPAVRRIVAGALAADDFLDADHRELARALLAAPQAGAEQLRERVEGEAAQRLLLQLVFEAPPVVEKEAERVVVEAIEFITRRQPQAQRRQALARQIEQAQAAGDMEQVRRLQIAYLQLISPRTPSAPGGADDGEEEGA